MKQDWKYILYITLAIAVYAIVQLSAPKQYDWRITFSHQDKNPYGAFALHELLPALFTNVSHSYKTIYEVEDSLSPHGSIFIVATNFSADEEDTKVLFRHVHNGGSAFISAQHFWGSFADSLGVSTYDYLFQVGGLMGKEDTSIIRFANPRLDTTLEFSYRRDNVHNYFNSFDTTRTTVIAKNDYEYPVAIRIKYGKGNFILNSTPLALTNIYLLSEENHRFISDMLSYLPSDKVLWTEYYQMGRMETSTPLRFILSSEPLRWAYYIAIAAILLFMAFEMKRRQRIIPVIKPLGNTTLEFVSTIGNLYYQNGDHKNIAEKKILFFLDQIRSRFWLNTNRLDDAFTTSLAKKSGKDQEEVRKIVDTINNIRSQPSISADELLDLNTKIESFNF